MSYMKNYLADLEAKAETLKPSETICIRCGTKWKDTGPTCDCGQLPNDIRPIPCVFAELRRLRKSHARLLEACEFAKAQIKKGAHKKALPVLRAAIAKAEPHNAT